MSTAVSGPSGHPPLPGAGSPTVDELERLLRDNTVALSRVDEVWPSLYIGDMTAAHDRYQLWKLGITHVLNAAHKQLASSGCQDFYGITMDYRGIAARDLPHFDISAYFYSAAEYIHQAVDVLGGKVFVHCAFGYSRAATLALAYLMIHQRLSLWEAVSKVAKHRRIYPNRGFLKQLRILDTKLQQERKV